MAQRTADLREVAADPPRSSARRLVTWALLGLPLIVLAQRAWTWRWISDDGFIHLRVVRQVVSGNGPVFNVGERVEASTSPLWVFVLSAADVATPVRLEWLAVLLGIGLSLAGVAFAMAGARRFGMQTGHRGVLLPAGAAAVVALPPNWTFASSGLEGGLVLAWLGACFLLLARWSSGGLPLPAPSAVLIGLGPLIRPELGLFMVLFLAVPLATDRHRQRGAERLRLLGAALAVPIAYQIFRMGYYGSPVPNPAIAKEASRSWWSRGWSYFEAMNDTYWLWVALVVLAVAAYGPMLRDLSRGRRWRAVAVALATGTGGLLHGLYVIRVGGDFMEARLLLPSFFAFAAPVAVVPLRPRFAGAVLILPWALAAGLFMRSFTDENTNVRQKVTLDDLRWGEGQASRVLFTGVRGDGGGFYYSGRRIEGAVPADGRATAVANFGVGLPGYALGPEVYVIDLLALADPLTAHFELKERAFVPGHEKPLPAAWLAARYLENGQEFDEDQFPGGTYGVGRLDAAPQGTFTDRVTTAQDVLRCEAMRDLRASYTAALTPRRFLANLFDALPRYRFRIPVEPAEARDELC